MLLTQFPDLTWLKREIRNRFETGIRPDGQPFQQVGWPTAILNFRAFQAERRDIQGPFSLFMNRTGQSRIHTGGREVLLTGQSYLLTRPGQHYDLMLDSEEGTEILNVHFGDEFYREASRSLSLKEEKMLDDPASDLSFSNDLPAPSGFKSFQLARLADRVVEVHGRKDNELEREEALFALFSEVLGEQFAARFSPDQLSTRKVSTRQELFRRLVTALDLMHSSFGSPLSLDELAKVSCLSKYHFLRVFRQVVGQSPYQYLKSLRIRRSIELLRHTDQSLAEIAHAVGIENGSSLSRLIYTATQARPAAFRGNS